MTEDENKPAKRPYNRKPIEPMEMQVGQDNPRDMPMDGPARITDPLIEPVDGPNWKDKARELAFMEEIVDVLVHETTDENAEPYPGFGVNGRWQYFERGTQMQVKRKYVERLARAKRTAYTQRNTKDQNGNDAIRHDPHTALKYPFTVVHDPNPRGRDWLRKILSEA